MDYGELPIKTGRGKQAGMLEKLREKLNKRSITQRWVMDVMTIVVCVFLACFITASVLVKNHYYSAVESYISSGSSSAINNYFDLYLEENASFADSARGFIENYNDRDKVEVWIINSQGRIVGSSSGFRVEQQEMPDYTEALSSKSKRAKWVGKLPSTGERVMAYTYIVDGGTSSQMGAVRFICSLETVDREITLLIGLMFLLFSFLLAIVIGANLLFIKSITGPVKSISENAKKIAAGDFNVRIEKQNHDELGSLADVINNMAGEIAATDTMKNDFISTISHELRTPLTSIKGWGETLIMDPQADPQLTHRGLQVIINESGRLSGFVEELLDFSRMQSGHMTLRLNKIDILAELDETVFVFKERALREGIEVQYNAPDLPAPAMADANRIKQVFVNILDNALKYNNEGGRVFVSAEIEGEQIKVIVADNGCGISSQDLPYVKKKFYKANISVKGSGIGLAVADEIIGLHHGTLDIESVEKEGTTVTIILPLFSGTNTEPERTQGINE